MDDTVQIKCTRCKSAFRERARRIQSGYSRQCPNCEVILFFEESTFDKNVQTAMREARRVRQALRLEEKTQASPAGVTEADSRAIGSGRRAEGTRRAPINRSE
jgi:predicted  nucleic acid-binding Zn-ribbon protein